jgi:hypothetical protein
MSAFCQFLLLHNKTVADMLWTLPKCIALIVTVHAIFSDTFSWAYRKNKVIRTIAIVEYMHVNAIVYLEYFENHNMYLSDAKIVQHLFTLMLTIAWCEGACTPSGHFWEILFVKGKSNLRGVLRSFMTYVILGIFTVFYIIARDYFGPSFEVQGHSVKLLIVLEVAVFLWMHLEGCNTSQQTFKEQGILEPITNNLPDALDIPVTLPQTNLSIFSKEKTE